VGIPSQRSFRIVHFGKFSAFAAVGIAALYVRNVIDCYRRFGLAVE
jgi:hypothetical protein